MLLNITPDHLDRYPSMAEYSAAKFNLFKNQGHDDVMVLNADDPLLRDAGRLGRGRPFWFSASRARSERRPSGGAVTSSWTWAPAGKRSPCAAIPCAAFTIWRTSWPPPWPAAPSAWTAAAIESGLAGFRGLPHRMEAAGTGRPRRVHQ